MQRRIFYLCTTMNSGLDDRQILDGLRKHDESLTRQYFYGYCRMAYYIYNRRYSLAGKPGMDFFSLAHEYYLALDNKQWRQMEDRKPGTTLKDWMIGGFRFLVLDKLKQSEYERMATDIEKSSRQRQIAFDIGYDSTFNEDIRNTLEEIANRYYGRDSKASIILKLLLVDGYKGKDVAAMLNMSPSAVTQRYQKMMKDVVIPFFKQYYEPVYGFGVTALYGEEYDRPVVEPVLYKLQPDLAESPLTITQHKTPDNMARDISKRITPDHIDNLNDNEIFVFGSNLSGMHGGGAARLAFQRFGAVMGQGVGLQGQSYGIPTMQGGTETIAPYVDEFIAFARQHPDKQFLVTRIGCGIAGFSPDEIAPLFAKAVDVDNISLPADFWQEITPI